VLYFFFRAGHPDFEDSIALLRSLLAQIFNAKRNDGDIIDRFAFIMDERSSGQLYSTRSAMTELIQLCVDGSETVFIVVDGLDESNDPETAVKDLLLITRETNAKLLFFSRPNMSVLYKSVLETQRLNIRDKNSQDIETYAISRLEEMAEDELLPSHLDQSDLVGRLTLGANGMFLWIRLMVNFLNSSALTRRQRSDAILKITVPEGLESMYHRIAQLIQSSNTVERDLARRIFTWLLNCKRPLTIRELQIAISQSNSIDVRPL
jgi:hypothetical protein